MKVFYFSRRECVDSFVGCIGDAMPYEVIACKSGWFEYWVVQLFPSEFRIY